MAGNDQVDWPYWAVDIPQLTQMQAEWVVSMVNGGPHSMFAFAVDPRQFFRLNLDRTSVVEVRAALVGTGVAPGLLESIDEWLEWADPDEDEG